MEKYKQIDMLRNYDNALHKTLWEEIEMAVSDEVRGYINGKTYWKLSDLLYFNIVLVLKRDIRHKKI